MSDISVDPPALNAFADREVGRRDQMEQVRSQMSAVHLERGVFGYIPGIGERIHEAYDDYVTGLADAADRAVEAFLSVAEAVREASAAYVESDVRSEGVIRAAGDTPYHPGVK